MPVEETDSEGKSELRKTLESLARDTGIHRANLYDLLGHELQTILSVESGGVDAVRHQVEARLNELINEALGSKLLHIAIAQACFNIHPQISTDLKLIERQKAFTELHKSHPSERTVRYILRDKIYPNLERTLRAKQREAILRQGESVEKIPEDALPSGVGTALRPLETSEHGTTPTFAETLGREAPVADAGLRQSATPRSRFQRRHVLAGGALVAASALVAAILLKNDGSSETVTPPASPSPSAAAQPVQVLSAELASTGNGYLFVFPDELQRTADELSELDDLRRSDRTAYEKWFYDRGAAVGGAGVIKLVLRGNSTDGVVISDIKITKECQRPIYGTVFFGPGQADEADIPLGFALDGGESTAQHFVDHKPVGDYFEMYSISLEPGEQETIGILVETASQYCEFSLNLHVVAVDGIFDEVVRNGDAPFRLTAIPAGLRRIPHDYSSYGLAYAAGTSDNSDAARGLLEWEQVKPDMLRN